MSHRRYAMGQLLFAFVVAAVGAVKAARLLVDAFEEGVSDLAGLK